MKSLKNPNNLLYYFLPIFYISSVTFYMLLYKAQWLPIQFFSLIVVITLAFSFPKSLLRYWLIVPLLYFSYEYMRGVLPLLSQKVLISPIIKAEETIFGFIPTIEFQKNFYTEGVAHWYDYLSTILYLSHHFIPLIVAYFFWRQDKKYFQRFASAFFLLTFLGFFSYLLFPTMPPWMASLQGYLPPVKKVLDIVVAPFVGQNSVSSFYQFLGANQIAAFPSLHAACPWLIFLFAYKKIGRKALFLVPYVLGVWFAVVYLGEHYVIDVMAGMVFATISFYLIFLWENRPLNLSWKGGDKLWPKII